ncbi:MAG: patatin-like protein [Pacificimonas sp.]|jgi:patatin-related protein|nr:patatin-like protein [Pacificimonas sp.]
MREKELRLALVYYGGISLAVYMHGITREIWKLLRASHAVTGGEAIGPGDTEAVYADLLRAGGDESQLRVVVDIVAGASAGGINGIFLAEAIATGASLDPLVDLWLGKADVDELLDPKAVPKSGLTKFYAKPLLRFIAKDRSVDLTTEMVEAGARNELREKLSRFVRSRWFEPPFSGERFSRFLLEAFHAMHGDVGAPLLPERQPLDLFVTVTDFFGAERPLLLNSPPVVEEVEHRKTIAFRDGGAGRRAAYLGSAASLASAARATASFPGAFPPFQAREMEAVLDARGETWDDRDAFLAAVFPNRPADESLVDIPLLDGSILNNAPFGPALAALKNRPAYREVDRRFVYIDPKPGIRSIGVGRRPDTGPPGFFTTILKSLSDIPREQPIRDDLEALGARSRRAARMQTVLSGMAKDTDRAITAALGARVFGSKPSPAKLGTLRNQATSMAAERAGFTYPAYARLKLIHVQAELAQALMTGEGADDPLARERLLLEVAEWCRKAGVDDIVRVAKPKEAARDRYIGFLRRFDNRYRIRRLRYMIRQLGTLDGSAVEPEIAASAERARAALFEMLGPWLDREQASFARTLFDGATDAGIAERIERLGAGFDLAELDEETERRLSVLVCAAATAPSVRRVLLRAYLGFPFYDMATFPLLQGEGLEEWGEIKVDRISPDDAPFLRAGGAETTLKGIRFNSFGAFFSRAYRENDYLWGRLHGAERLIEIVASSLPADARPAGAALDGLKQRALLAILDAEAARLTTIPDLIETLRAELRGRDAAEPVGDPRPPPSRGQAGSG